MNQKRTITLTLLASITAVSLVGCGKSPKEQARERAACVQDPHSEDCLSGGRSHSGVGYFFFGNQHYGQPSYYGTPAYTSMYSSPATAYSGWSSSAGRSVSTPSTSSYSGGNSGDSTGATAGAAAGFAAGSVSTGGFGASAAGHAGGGGGGE